jgi:hypothetical protein
LPVGLTLGKHVDGGNIQLRRVIGAAFGAVVATHLTACGGPGDSGMVGLPPSQFERAYAAGYDVAAAERCGQAIDAGLVRHNLIAGIQREGMDPVIVEKAGRTFDKTRAEFTRKLQTRPEYCVTEYAVPRERLAQYEKGEFPPR